MIIQTRILKVDPTNVSFNDKSKEPETEERKWLRDGWIYRARRTSPPSNVDGCIRNLALAEELPDVILSSSVRGVGFFP